MYALEESVKLTQRFVPIGTLKRKFQLMVICY